MLETSTGQLEGSLYALLCHAVTPFGKVFFKFIYSLMGCVACAMHFFLSFSFSSASVSAFAFFLLNFFSDTLFFLYSYLTLVHMCLLLCACRKAPFSEMASSPAAARGRY